MGKLVQRSRVIVATAAALLGKMKDEAAKRWKHERIEVSNIRKHKAASKKRILQKLHNTKTMEAEMLSKYKEEVGKILRKSKASVAEYAKRLTHLRAREARVLQEKFGSQTKLTHVHAHVTELLGQIKIKQQEAANRVEELSKAAAKLARLGDTIHHKKMEGMAFEGDMRRAAH